MFNVHLLKKTKSIWLIPFLLMTILMFGHLIFQNYADYLINNFGLMPELNLIEQYAFPVFIGFCEYWLISRIINTVLGSLKKISFFQKHQTGSIILPFLASVLKTLTVLILFNIITEKLNLPKDLASVLNKVSSIFIICAISGILFKLIPIAEQILLHHYTAELRGHIVERKIFTQTLILKRVAYSIITVLSGGSILVLFDSVRTLGASVLTTAGVFGLVLTFTAQRSLGSIISSLEIALTQPIKIGDKVLLENELGTVEEINFRSVVIKLGDWRRLIVPTNFFLEKSFQNWSRVEHTNLIGMVYLYVDFTMPIQSLRNKLYSILQKSDLWDKNVGEIQVSDLQQTAMQLKVSASARSPEDVSKLRALLREELMNYIVNTFPDSLPKTRSCSPDTEVKERDVSEQKIYVES